MYLLYIDESGTPKGTGPGSSNHFVLSGVALHEEDCFPLARALDAMVARSQRRQPDLEIHATDLWAGRHDWARVPRTERHALLDQLLELMGTWVSPGGRSPRYFAAAVHKESHKGKDILQLAHEELFARFDSCLNRFHLAGDSHRSLVISDESSYERLVQTLVPKWKQQGSRIGKLNSLVEVPLYVDSRSSRLVQAADLVAWATWQYYEHNGAQFLQPINARFDCDGGVQHGLAHLNRSHRTCRCVACSSHRDRVVGDTVPKL
jgi:hypothetical protein